MLKLLWILPDRYWQATGNTAAISTLDVVSLMTFQKGRQVNRPRACGTPEDLCGSSVRIGIPL